MAGETRSSQRPARAAFPGDANSLLNRLNDDANPPQPVASAQSLRYAVRLITPLFGGGVEPGVNDLQLPVRMKGLRGQLRSWWRLLAAHGGLADCGLGPPADMRALYAEEAARWGGADANWAPIPGRIGLRALNPQGFDLPVDFEVFNNGRYQTAPHFSSPGRSIEYGLFPAKHGEQDGSPPKGLILPGATFTLEVSVRAAAAPNAGQIVQELRLTVAWWATFGGIGARWRRGAGSVCVRDENNNLLCVLDDDQTNPSSLPAWASARTMQLKTRPACHAPERAWAQAIGRLKAFRQEPGTGREGRLSPKPPIYGRSFWPEAHLARHHHDPSAGWVHTLDPQFIGAGAAAFAARGAFGLPLGIKFPQIGEPPDTEFVPVGSNRMASPLILRAVARPDNSFTPCALLLPWWRETLGIPLEAKPDGPGAPATGYRVWPDDHAARLAAAAAIRPINASLPAGTSDPDPLSAFMAFFPQ